MQPEKYQATLNFINLLIYDIALFDLDYMLMGFVKTHGVPALEDMFYFCRWAVKTDLDLDVQRMTIMHDLGGRNDKLMTPRTSRYKEKFEELMIEESEQNDYLMEQRNSIYEKGMHD